MREKKDINIEIGGNIQVAREQAGYTQDTLSEMLGMTPNHLSAIERGASGISLEALQRLCRLLGVSADRIIFGTDEPEAEACCKRSLEFPIIQQSCNQHDEARSSIMYQRPGSGIQQSENRERDRKKVDAHGKRYAELDGFHRCIGKSFQVRNF